MQDVLINNRCHDIDRIEYLKIHLGAVLDAVEAGVTWTDIFYGVLLITLNGQRDIQSDLALYM